MLLVEGRSPINKVGLEHMREQIKDGAAIELHDNTIHVIGTTHMQYTIHLDGWLRTTDNGRMHIDELYEMLCISAGMGGFEITNNHSVLSITFPSGDEVEVQ